VTQGSFKSKSALEEPGACLPVVRSQRLERINWTESLVKVTFVATDLKPNISGLHKPRLCREITLLFSSSSRACLIAPTSERTNPVPHQ
jgi:hypothetical protein